MISHGERFQRIEILERQKPAPAYRSELGESRPPYRFVASVYAKISPVSGREIERAKSFGAEVSHRIYMRYTPHINHNSILRYNNRRFHVDAVLNTDERNDELLIYATEQLGEKP